MVKIIIVIVIAARGWSAKQDHGQGCYCYCNQRLVCKKDIVSVGIVIVIVFVVGVSFVLSLLSAKPSKCCNQY